MAVLVGRTLLSAILVIRLTQCPPLPPAGHCYPGFVRRFYAALVLETCAGHEGGGIYDHPECGIIDGAKGELGEVERESHG